MPKTGGKPRLFRRLRSGKSKQENTTDVPTAMPVPQDDPGHGDLEQSLLVVPSTAAGSSASEQPRPTFSNVLDPVTPDASGTSFKKTSWTVFMQVLKGVKEASGVCEPLEAAVGGLLVILEQYEMMKDAEEELDRVAQKMNALRVILARHDSTNIPEATKDRLNGLANWIKSVTISIEKQSSRGQPIKFLDAPEDRKKIAELTQTLTQVIDLFELDTSIATEKYLGKIETKIDEFANDAILNKLNHVTAASFTSQRGDTCLEGTRCAVIANILEWCNDTSCPPVYWLNGMAGTGKSAIARSVCDLLETAGLLGGSFFCSRRASAEEQDIRRIIPTLTRQLCWANKDYLQRVVERLKVESDIVGATVWRQLEELIVKPCRGSSFPKPLILVIDALDEGARTDDTEQLLEAILGQAAAEGFPVRFFVTSRPENHIRSRFSDPSHASERVPFHLHDIEAGIVRADIHLYITHRLNKIKSAQKSHLPVEWPSEWQIEHLVDRAEKLFIYAFTACNYIERDPDRRLNKIVDTPGGYEKLLIKRLDEMYMLILDEAMENDQEDTNLQSIIRKCLVVLVLARGTFSVGELAKFIDTDARDIYIAVQQLHSLILMPDSEDGEVTTLHASLGDYLLDQSRSGKHFIPNEAHFELLQRCFNIMDSKLRFNVAQARTSFKSNKDQGLTLPQHLLYAAGRWSDHVVRSGLEEQPAVIVGWIEMTLMPKFLFWLEVVSIAERVETVPEMLQTLLSFVKTKPTFVRFINDAIHFVDECREPISRSTPHIYLSALAYSWEGSMIHENFYTGYSRIAQMKYIGANRLKTWDISLIGQTSTLHSVSFSPDGTRIVSIFTDKKIRVWDIQTGQSVVSLIQEHNYFSSFMFFGIHGLHRISYDATVQMWDVHTGRPILPPLKGDHSDVTSVAFLPDGTRIVSGSDSGTVQVWDAQTGQLVIPPLKGHTQTVHSVAFSPDGTRIVSGSSDKTIIVWNALTGQFAIPPLRGHTERVNCVVFSLDNTRIVSGSSDSTVRIWDVQTGHPVMLPLQGHDPAVTSIAISRDGTCIVSGYDDSTVKVWDIRTGQPTMQLLQGDTGGITSVAFSPDGARIVTGSFDGTVRVWNVQLDSPLLPLLPRHTNTVQTVVFSQDGTRIISGSIDKIVRVWDALTGQPTMPPLRLEGGTEYTYSIAFSLDGTRIVSGSDDYMVRVWNMHNGQLVMPPLQGHTQEVHSVAFSADGARIVSGSSDNTVRVWNAQTGQPAMPLLQGHADSVMAVAFSPDGTRIVSGSTDHTIRIWDARSGQLAMPPLHNYQVTSVAFSPNGTYIVSGSADDVVRVWDVSSGQLAIPPLELEGNHNFVRSVGFSPDGTRVVSGYGDGLVCIWDTITRLPAMPPLQGHTGNVNSVAFSPSGTHIVSGSKDKTVRVWDVQPETSYSAMRIIKEYSSHSSAGSSIFSPDGNCVISPSEDNSIQGLNFLPDQPNTSQSAILQENDISIAAQSFDSRVHLRESQETVHILNTRAYPSYILSNPTSSSRPGTNRPVCNCDNANLSAVLDPSPRESLNIPSLPFQLSKIPLFHPDSPVSDPHNLFFFDVESNSSNGHGGWIKGPNGELFIWIPPDLQSSLHTPRTVFIKSQFPHFLDLSNFAYGEDWTSCREVLSLKEREHFEVPNRESNEAMNATSEMDDFTFPDAAMEEARPSPDRGFFLRPRAMLLVLPLCTALLFTLFAMTSGHIAHPILFYTPLSLIFSYIFLITCRLPNL